jgi:predicted Rossmann fold nucleotide-binding protein DprA/Smf involved in DNA uptake
LQYVIDEALFVRGEQTVTSAVVFAEGSSIAVIGTGPDRLYPTRTGLAAEVVTVALVELDLSGRITPLAGCAFQRVR